MKTRLREEMVKTQHDWHDDYKITFDIVDGLGGKTICEWVDPWEGTFKIKGTRGVSLVKDYKEQNPLIDNIQKIKKDKKIKKED